MSIIHGRWLQRSTVSLGAALALILVTATPAAAVTSHTFTLKDGAAIDVDGGIGLPIGGDVECSDGLDNDEDGDIDAGADAECDPEVGGLSRPATDDDSECIDGFQAPSSPPVIPFDDDEMGGLTNFDGTFPPIYICSGGPIGTVCFAIWIVIEPSSASGSVTDVVPGTSAEITAGPFDITIDVEECDVAGAPPPPPGFDGTDCEVTFPDVSLSTAHFSPRGPAFHGSTYTESGGLGWATLAARIPSGPAFGSGDCGGFFGTDYADELNARWGLPDNVDIVWPGEIAPDLSSV